jgi:DNA replication licensing factor MCM2
LNLEDYSCSLKEWLETPRTQTEIKKRFKAFLEQQPTEDDPFDYFKHHTDKVNEMCTENRQSFDVSFIHLTKVAPLLGVWLADRPTSMLELFHEVGRKFTFQSFSNYSNIHSEIFVRITHLPVEDSLRNLRQIHLNAFIKVSGVVTRRTGVFPQIKLVLWKCTKCGNRQGPYEVRPMSEPTHPTKCPECQSPLFTVDQDGSEYRNYQKIVLQESPGSVPPGRVPRWKEVILLADLVDIAKPGDEIEVVGVYCNSYDKALNTKNGFPVFSTIIFANNITKVHEVRNASLTEEGKKISRCVPCS